MELPGVLLEDRIASMVLVVGPFGCPQLHHSLADIYIHIYSEGYTRLDIFPIGSRFPSSRHRVETRGHPRARSCDLLECHHTTAKYKDLIGMSRPEMTPTTRFAN